MRILVTGGCGFIGSALVLHLVQERGHDVLTLDALTYEDKIMNRCVPALLALAIGGMLACSTPSDNTTTTKTTTATTANTTNGGTTTASTATTGSETKIGVAECDEYLAKYEKCLEAHVPAAYRATYKTSMDSARNAYRQAAATAEGRATLAQTCKSALETSKQSLAAYKCEW